MPKTSTKRKGNQAAGTRKTKVNAKGKHVETGHEEAVARSAQDLRENVLSQNWCKQLGDNTAINFFITRDTTFAIYVFEEGHVRVTNLTTNRFIELFYERFAWHDCSLFQSLPRFFTVFSIIFSFRVLRRVWLADTAFSFFSRFFQPHFLKYTSFWSSRKVFRLTPKQDLFLLCLMFSTQHTLW